MPLKLRLKSGEKFVINGAVITAGEDGASLILQNRASILRGGDIMQEHEANTPTRKIYFYIMLLYLEPQHSDKYMPLFIEYMGQLASATTLVEVKRSLMFIYQDVATGQYYRALKTCKALITLETALLNEMKQPNRSVSEDKP